MSRSVRRHGVAVAILVLGALLPARAGAVVRPGEDVFEFGDAGFHGSTADVGRLNAPLIDIAPTATGEGYWLLSRDGGVFSFGDAPFHGSTGGMVLNQPVVAMAADPQGRGYWFASADGGVFSFGVPFFGSMGGRPLNRPVVGMAPTPTGDGYWLVSDDGGVFSFGDAAFHGSTGGIPLVQPIVDVAADPDGTGYWLAAADGGVFSFSSSFHGSAAGQVTPGDRVVGIAADGAGPGYWLASERGGVFSFGGAPFHGSAAGSARRIVGIAGTPAGSGYWLAADRTPFPPALLAVEQGQAVTGLYLGISESPDSPEIDEVLGVLERIGFADAASVVDIDCDAGAREALDADEGLVLDPDVTYYAVALYFPDGPGVGRWVSAFGDNWDPSIPDIIPFELPIADVTIFCAD